MTERLRKIIVAICWLVGAALVFMNVRLAADNRELTAQVGRFYRAIELPIGARVPPLVGWDRNRKDVVVDFSLEEQPVLLLVFSPACPVCDDNWPNWERLVSRQRQRGGKVITVDMTKMVRDDYLRAHGIDSVPVVDSVTPETSMSFRFRFTPQTLILHGGRVAAGWMGVLTPSDVAYADSILDWHRESVDDWGVAPKADPSDIRSMRDMPIRPFCDGLPCAKDSECGSKCACEGNTSTSLGTCVANAKMLNSLRP